MSTHHDDSAAVAETRLVHEVQRRATSLLADALGGPSYPVKTVADLRDFVVATLHHHHRREDTALWPLVVAAAPELIGPLEKLSEEHEQLDHQLDALHALPIRSSTSAAAAERAVAVRDLVHDHLGREEPVLFPALREHISVDGWEEFSAHTVATSPPEGTHLLVALLYATGSQSDVAVIFRHLPAPARERLPSMRALGVAALEQVGGARAGTVR